jgi:hypothetical protein
MVRRNEVRQRITLRELLPECAKTGFSVPLLLRTQCSLAHTECTGAVADLRGGSTRLTQQRDNHGVTPLGKVAVCGRQCPNFRLLWCNGRALIRGRHNVSPLEVKLLAVLRKGAPQFALVKRPGVIAAEAVHNDRAIASAAFDLRVGALASFVEQTKTSARAEYRASHGVLETTVSGPIGAPQRSMNRTWSQARRRIALEH